MTNQIPNAPLKGIAVAALLLAIAASASARMVDSEGGKAGWREKAEREQREHDQRENIDRERSMPERRDSSSASREVPAVHRAEPKVTYVREQDGGVTAIVSTAGGTQVTHLRPDGRVVRGVSSNEPRHAQYTDEAQRSGGTVVSKPEGERRISEIKGGETARQQREREQQAAERRAEQAELRSMGGRSPRSEF